jgi:hypothetical protein
MGLHSSPPEISSAVAHSHGGTIFKRKTNVPTTKRIGLEDIKIQDKMCKLLGESMRDIC